MISEHDDQDPFMPDGYLMISAGPNPPLDEVVILVSERHERSYEIAKKIQRMLELMGDE